MSTFPGSPRLLRGGFVLVDPTTAAVVRIIALQYNPESLTRNLQVKGAGGEGGDVLEAQRLTGPAVETIKLEAEIDATDLLEAADTQTVEVGLHPQLAKLESMIHPSTQDLLANHSEASSGTIEIAPMQGPLSLFVFGPNRIVPVRLTEFSITEEAFDTALNPIRAKISLGMRVLNVDDLGFDSPGGGLFMSYLQAKERLASQGSAATLGALGITGVPGA